MLDIYIHDTSINDWSNWIDFVNEKYVLGFHKGESWDVENKIKFEVIKAYWDRRIETGSRVWFKIKKNLELDCDFIGSNEIENNFKPDIINSIEDHNALVDYMQTISLLLGKKVILSPQSVQEIKLIECDATTIAILE